MFASGTGLLCMPNLSDLGTDTDCGRAARAPQKNGGWSIGANAVRSVLAFGLKHLLRKAAAREAETICVTIGEIRAFTPNAPPISETQAMPNPKSIML
jgi:hypothetical protein